MSNQLYLCNELLHLISQARRALQALRGLMRLKSLIQGQSIKRQATTTLRCMQTLARVQSQIHARRLGMSEENQALQRQLQQKCEKELEKLRASVSAWVCIFYSFDCRFYCGCLHDQWFQSITSAMVYIQILLFHQNSWPL